MGKKILMLILTAVMVFSLKETVHATDINTNGGSATVPVKYTVDNTSFIITVPTVIWADKTETQFEITAKEINIRPDEHLQVFITEGCNSEGKIILDRQGVAQGNEAQLETTALVGGKIVSANNFRVGHFKDSSSITNLDGKVTLSGLNVDEKTRAGDYQSTICFKVELSKDDN